MKRHVGANDDDDESTAAVHCPICLDHFHSEGAGSHVPVMLTQCGHSVCSACWDGLLRQLNSAEPHPPPWVLSCPLCRTVTGVHHVRRNVALMQIADVLWHRPHATAAAAAAAPTVIVVLSSSEEEDVVEVEPRPRRARGRKLTTTPVPHPSRRRGRAVVVP